MPTSEHRIQRTAEYNEYNNKQLLLITCLYNKNAKYNKDLPWLVATLKNEKKTNFFEM